MSAKVMLIAMVAGATAVIGLGRRDHDPPAKPVHTRPTEVPWLSREAAAELIDRDGGPGPLFADLIVGGSAPSAQTRMRIAAFARQHRVDIELEVADDELAAIRLGVSYSGGFGYEGADVLALRLQRPSTGHCCVCGNDKWIDDWELAGPTGVHVRARVRWNRVEAVWERTLTAADVIARADALLGRDVASVREAARDRWIELEPGLRYALELPLEFARYPQQVREGFDTPGLQLGVRAGRIVEVAFTLRDRDTDRPTEDEAAALLRARWGRPRVDAAHDRWTWRLPDRSVTADAPGAGGAITIKARPRV